jgi:c(7)-type cytochrome triheme protein
MTPTTLLKKCFLIFSAYLLLVGNGLADESYDPDEYGPEAPIVWKEPAMATFDHKTHTMDVGLECADCHDDIFAMESKAESGRETFTMKAMAEGQSCGACHNGSDAFDSASQCGSCHFPPAEKIIFTEPVKVVVFDHSIHVTKAELSCESCHKEVFSMKQGGVEAQKPFISDDPAEKRQYLTDLHKKYCGTCHDSSQAFGYLTRCTVCHIGVKGLAELTGEETKKDGHEKSNH